MKYVLCMGYLCVLSLFSSMGQADEIDFYKDYQFALQSYVDDQGLVNYQALQEQPFHLNRFIKAIDTLSLSEYERWDDAQKIAFWMNAYNALTLQVILDHYPIKWSLFKRLWYPRNSIRHIKGVWDVIEFGVMGQGMTLNHIEHQILRKEFSFEPRVHMALVCASLGCPLLRSEAYRGDILDAQLKEQSATFLQYERNFSIDHQKQIVYLSKIFEWFADDFKNKYGDGNAVMTFIKQHLTDARRQELEKAEDLSYLVKYHDYDWTLNEV